MFFFVKNQKCREELDNNFKNLYKYLLKVYIKHYVHRTQNTCGTGGENNQGILLNQSDRWEGFLKNL